MEGEVQVVQIDDSYSPPATATATAASSSSFPEHLQRLPFYLPSFIRIFTTPLVYFIETSSVEKKIEVFYFLFALKKHIPYLLGSFLVISVWTVLVEQNMESFLIRLITSTLGGFLICTLVFMLGIVFVKGVDYWLHNKVSLREIEAHIYDEYLVQKFKRFLRESNDSNMTVVQLKRIKRAFTNMSHTICDQVESSDFSGHEHQVEDDMSLVVKNLTDDEPRDIQETDLLQVMNEENIAKFLQSFHAATETTSINQQTFRDWVTLVCNRRKRVVQLLNNTGQETEQLIYVRVAQVYLVALYWCLSMRNMTITSSVYSSPILLIFGKILVDIAVLARVKHSVDIGDHCIIDKEKEQYVVEDIRHNSTVFRKDNKETVTLTNLSLYTKFISNLNRTSKLKETFKIHVSSSNDNAALKLEIDKFISSKPENWDAEWDFNLIGAKDGEDIYNLEITNVRNFQNFKVQNEQRSEFILHFKGLMDNLGIVNFTIK